MGFLSQKHGGWGQLEPIFRLAQVTFRFRLYIPITRLIPEEVIHGIGHLLAVIIGGKSVRKNILSALQIMYKDQFSLAKYQKIANHTTRFIGLFAFDTIFILPSLTPARLRERIEIQNVHYYIEALQRGKGIIATSIHLSQFFRGVVCMPILPEPRRVYAIGNPTNLRLFNLPFQQANIKVIPSVAFQKSKRVLRAILQNNDVLIIAWDMGGRDTQLKVKFLDFLLPSPGSVVSLASDTGATILPCVMLPKDGYKKQILRFLPPVTLEDKGSRKETFGFYNTYLNALFTPYFRQYPFLWEELLGLSWRTRRVFQFPNGANQAQIAGLGSEFLRHLVETSWEQGREDPALIRICDSLRTLYTGTDARFQAYPFRSQKKVRQISVDLPRDSASAIFRRLLEFLARFPDVQGFLSLREQQTFKRRRLLPEQEIHITAQVKELLSMLGRKAKW